MRISANPDDDFMSSTEHRLRSIIREKDEALSRLSGERINLIDYSADLQRIIEDLCHSRTVRTPKTTARYHYDLAVQYRLQAETAERQRDEAIERAAKVAESFSGAFTNSRDIDTVLDETTRNETAEEIAKSIRSLNSPGGA